VKLLELAEQAEQAFQRWPTLKINNFAGVLVQCRAVVVCIVDIKIHLDYSMFHRRLLFTNDFSGIAYHFEVSISDGSPRPA